MDDENKCNQCTQKGICCNHAIRKGNTLFILPTIPCEFLQSDGTCFDFDNRFRINPLCASMEQVQLYGGMPNCCVYKQEGMKFKFDRVVIAHGRLLKRLTKEFKEGKPKEKTPVYFWSV
jgi:uncharacterized cysteine cluster protein YcgN (CxxCxxCC family)